MIGYQKILAKYLFNIICQDTAQAPLDAWAVLGGHTVLVLVVKVSNAHTVTIVFACKHNACIQGGNTKMFSKKMIEK